jgi:choice-of-anchor A domain-containing protein
VKGAFHAPDYVVNANRGQDCSDKDSLNSYGLVVGGPLDTKNTQVHGAVYVAGSGDLTQIKGLENDCEVTNKKRTGLVDFIDLEKKATDYNIRLAAQPPTLQLNADNQVVRLGPTRGGMEFITFNSCNPSSLCENIWPNAMSNPNSVLFGQGNWNGVQGPQPDPGITYVFNVSSY